jgi:glycosyltransferase involved in cell wall biosynthesis
MRRAAVFVLPSEYEGLPNVLIQAMACGCPVVSTNCPSGPEDILDNGKYGHLVPVGDVQAMADAILRVLNGDAPLVPEEWLWQFHEERVAKQYLQLLLNHTQGRI